MTHLNRVHDAVLLSLSCFCELAALRFLGTHWLSSLAFPPWPWLTLASRLQGTAGPYTILSAFVCLLLLPPLLELATSSLLLASAVQVTAQARWLKLSSLSLLVRASGSWVPALATVAIMLQPSHFSSQTSALSQAHVRTWLVGSSSQVVAYQLATRAREA